MTDSQEGKAKGTQDSRAIHIEIPAGVFEAMYRIMSGRGISGTAASSCCEMARDACCPQAEDDDKQDFVFTLRRKG